MLNPKKSKILRFFIKSSFSVCLLFLSNTGLSQERLLNDSRFKKRSIPKKPRRLYDFVEWCGNSRKDVIGWEVPGNDIANFKNKVQYYYTPCFHFLKDPYKDYALTAVNGWENDSSVIVSLFLVRYNSDLLDRMVKKISFLENQEMNIHNLLPLPVLMLEVWPEHEWKLSFEVSSMIPPPTDPESTMFTGAEVLKIDFKIPQSHLNEFLHRIRDGFSFNIRYLYPSVEVERNLIAMNTKIAVSNELKQELFGNRNKIWATREQVLDFFSEVAIENKGKIHLENSDYAQTFFNMAQFFLEQTQTDVKEFGDLTRGEILTDFAIKPDDDFMRVDFTTLTEDQKAEARERIHALKSLFSEWKQKKGSGGFKFFGIGGGGGGEGASGRTNSDESLNKWLDEQAWSNRWEGKRSDPLKQKIYAIYKSRLDQHISTSLQLDVVGATGITPLATQRSTVRDVMDFDDRLIRELQASFPEVRLPTKGSPRRIR